LQDKRFQIFISSTYEDLKDERRAVEEVVISTGDFPVQMEAFPAADEDQFEFIKSLIDQCDYYVLIIAGRYGTQADDGFSYTEKEYQYAVSKNVPVLVMLHSDRRSLSADKTEEAAGGRKKLEKFISEASQGRLRKGWNTVDGLKLAVREALEHAKATKPRTGWVRGNSVASIEALEELISLRKENEKFKAMVGELEIDIPFPDIPDHNEEFEINLAPHFSRGGGYSKPYGNPAQIKCSWISAFPLFFSNLDWSKNDYDDQYFYHINEDESCIQIGSAFATQLSDTEMDRTHRISKDTLERLISFYIEAGFMRAQGADEPFTETAKKFARRQRIHSDGTSNAFSLVSGDLSINDPNEIPF
jgi:hypothetical protein